MKKKFETKNTIKTQQCQTVGHMLNTTVQP